MFGHFGGKILQHVVVLRYELNLRTLPLLLGDNGFEIINEVLSFVESSLDFFE